MYSEAALTWFGTIATIFTFGSMAFSIIRAFRPSKQMRELDAVVTETETLLHQAEEEGLLTDPSFLQTMKERLSLLQDAVLLVRSDVHAASASNIQDYTGVFTGLAKKVSFVSKEVKELRATISRSSAEARMRLQEEERRAMLASNCAVTDGAPAVNQQEPTLGCINDTRNPSRSDSSMFSLHTIDSETTVVAHTDGAELKDDTYLAGIPAVRTAPMYLLAKFRATRTASASL